MKKILLAIVLLAAVHSVSMGQSSSAYSNGDNLLNIGVGVGTPFFGSGYSASIPVNPTISYEKGITDAISVGAAASYARSSYSFSGFGSTPYVIKETAIYVGARGAYHLGGLLDLGSDVDLYGGVSVGYVVVNVSDNQGGFAAAASGAGYGLFAGGKYFFSSGVGVYAQIGYESLSYLNVGLAFKF